MSPGQSHRIVLAVLVLAALMVPVALVLPVGIQSEFHGAAAGILAYREQTVRGWEFLWQGIRGSPGSPADDWMNWAVVAGLMAGGLVAGVSPVVAGVLRRSRILWWLAALSAIVSCCLLFGVLVYWMLILVGSDSWRPLPGYWIMVLVPWVNLAGLLAIRGRSAPAVPGRDP